MMWTGKALLLPSTEYVHGAMLVAEDDVVAALDRLRTDPGLRRSLGTGARDLATSDALRGDDIARRWCDVLALPPRSQLTRPCWGPRQEARGRGPAAIAS
jgi:hypothetical protein